MSLPSWGRLERLRPAQIDAIRDRAPIAYVPWGAIEWHSVHAPVGLDGAQALGQCVALAERTGGAVLPPVYVGTDTIKPFKGFPNTIEHGVSTVRALCHEFVEQLVEEGFRVVVVVTGHCGGGHVEALRDAIAAVEAPGADVLLIPSFEPIQEAYPSNHAARGETSFQLLFEPETVDLSLIPPGAAPTLDGEGVWGDDPRGASAQEGAAMLALFVDRTAPRIEALVHRHRS